MRAAIEVADIVRAAGPAYRSARAGHLSLDQLKVMSAIETCRTAALGGHVEACSDCGHQRIAYNSCRNRHCPRCQGAAARTWLEAQKTNLLPIGFYFHIDIAEVQTAKGKLYLYVAIDRTRKFAVVQVVRKTGRASASAFLVAQIEAVPHRIHTVLTDNGIQFTFPPRYADGPTARYMTHMFNMRCRENGIEHRLTKIKHPWTNGQVERMNRTIKEATVKRFHYDSHGQFEAHLVDFINAYNYGRRLKTLKGLTPYEYICKIWTSEPERFRLVPIHQTPILNT
ncbi:transposase zinc-binding domain-containing protein [Devosia alba]|uniref:transposase zinc-binding domain-containing protein n=1 Tax=Devosia alba TaxID=3152360 RepID=UPI003265933E